ncbi:hypothetical protein [Thermosynechococcus vestitus]|uniref:Tsl1998 protein n=1 Tax=Thermosynechococcus vestitus (strain NIES-2133 / IAM M-273 / BP-1) TaxID=197221 RepID=Q8DHG1_THEVB|nr:hypothetical protein [Thermosynechococcus vestitus]BAC09550.1 tsl1998 [Thermosynechococcus vestitus BP-1]
MAGSGEDIQPLFDLVDYPYRDLAPFRLQNSAEREAYELLRTILQTGTTIDIPQRQEDNYGSYSLSRDRSVMRPYGLAHWRIFRETLRPKN